MKKILLALLLLLYGLATTGCNNKELVIEKVNPVKLRNMQTRKYEETSKELVMRASLAAMQDLGFIIDRADLATGTVTGTKWEKGQVKLSLFIKEEQDNGVKIISLRANAQKGIYSIEVPQPYQAFFNVVNKSLYLENN